jgi:threonine/homoserine/homoserine lactone efflux protein
MIPCENKGFLDDIFVLLIYTIYMNIFVWTGILFGILVAIPTGPVAFLIIQRMYSNGLKSGMVSTAGSIIADGFYCAVVGFGLKFIADILLGYTHYFQLFVGIILIVTGVSIYRKHIALSHERTTIELVKDFTSVLFMNGMNPTLLVTFSGLFMGLGMGPFVGNVHAIVSFIMGMIGGQVLFWYVLGMGIVSIRKTQKTHLVVRGQKIIGAILGFVGIVLIAINITLFITKQFL